MLRTLPSFEKSGASVSTASVSEASPVASSSVVSASVAASVVEALSHFYSDVTNKYPELSY